MDKTKRDETKAAARPYTPPKLSEFGTISELTRGFAVGGANDMSGGPVKT
jgi:hypothetical protein